MITKKNIFYFLQFVLGSLLTFLGMYLIIFPNFALHDATSYHKVEYALLLLYLPAFVFHIVAYTLMNACHEHGITRRKRLHSILFITLFLVFLLSIGLTYLIFEKFPLAFCIYYACAVLFSGYLIYLTIKTFYKKPVVQSSLQHS